MSARSPNSCVRSLMYGVSPQPEQAPENSNSGCRSWLVLTLLSRTRRRSYSGRSRKNLKFSRSCIRIGRCGTMLMALSRGFFFVPGGAHFHADAAPGAVFGRDLDRVVHAGLEIDPFRLHRFEGGRSLFQEFRVIGLDPDGRVRAGDGAFAALDADIRDSTTEFRGRCCVSPIAPFRSGKCRPPGRRSPAGCLLRRQ